LSSVDMLYFFSHLLLHSISGRFRDFAISLIQPGIEISGKNRFSNVTTSAQWHYFLWMSQNHPSCLATDRFMARIVSWTRDLDTHVIECVLWKTSSQLYIWSRIVKSTRIEVFTVIWHLIWRTISLHLTRLLEWCTFLNRLDQNCISWSWRNPHIFRKDDFMKAILNCQFFIRYCDLVCLPRKIGVLQRFNHSQTSAVTIAPIHRDDIFEIVHSISSSLLSMQANTSPSRISGLIIWKISSDWFAVIRFRMIHSLSSNNRCQVWNTEIVALLTVLLSQTALLHSQIGMPRICSGPYQVGFVRVFWYQSTAVVLTQWSARTLAGMVCDVSGSR
jgi:hypothetical protein